MLENQYLHSIISNLGIAICPYKNREIFVKNTIFYDEKNDVFKLSNEYQIFFQNCGSIIADFQNTDFSNKDEFISFFYKYSLFGLENKKINKIFSNYICSTSVYNCFLEQSFKKYSKLLSLYQNDIHYILDYCLFNPHKKVKSLTPFERLCILEYTANNPSLLQSNHLETLHLNTLCNINFDSSEKELINRLSKKDITAYSDTLHIPIDISSLIHFELSEILKGNITLKICNYCDKYFIANNRHIIYCDNIAPGYTDKTCRQIARNKKYVQSQQKDDALALFTKVYNNKAYKASRYPDINSYVNDYELFKKIGRKKVNAYKMKKISKESFIEWIDNNK